MKVVIISMAAATLAGLAACGGGGDNPKERMVRPIPAPRFQPAPSATLSGKLTDQATSLPLQKVKVLAQAAHTLKILDSAATQADGSYTLTNLPVGVPLCLVAQPVTGAVLYETFVSAPLTLAKGAAPQKVDHAFASLPLGGAVEGRMPAAKRPVTRGGLILAHRVTLPGGKVFRAVVRTAPHKEGTFRFEALPPGSYDLVYTRFSPHAEFPTFGNGQAHRRKGVFIERVYRLTVKAGETCHVDFGRAAAQVMAEEGTEDEAED